MQIEQRNRSERIFPCHVLILPLCEKEGTAPYSALDASLKQLLARVIRSGEFTGQFNQTLLLHTRGVIKAERVLLTGLGPRKELTREKVRQMGGKAWSVMKGLRRLHAALSTASISSVRSWPTDFLEGILLASYRFDRYKKARQRSGAARVTLLSRAALKEEIGWTRAIAEANHFARDLVNTPANDMTPSSLVRAARSIKDVSVRVLSRDQARKLGLRAFLAVAQGSSEPARFIVLSYGRKRVPPLVLIGKSITFDSGGLSLKPAQAMEKMKYDMAGGAAVLGVMKALSSMKVPIPLTAILPATENLPDGRALKPGDVVKSFDGTSIEIISTDAEGRLALADAIGYARTFKPSAIIDIATLTGACPVAFGGEAIALMGNNEKILDSLRKAGDETHERLWKMPLFEEYRDYITSDIADLKNSAGKTGALASSGFFLREFAGDTPWAHLDIAGTAWTDKDRPYIPKGATGVGVRLLVEFLRRAF